MADVTNPSELDYAVALAMRLSRSLGPLTPEQRLDVLRLARGDVCPACGEVVPDRVCQCENEE